jgi:hypothetical protein
MSNNLNHASLGGGQRLRFLESYLWAWENDQNRKITENVEQPEGIVLVPGKMLEREN